LYTTATVEEKEKAESFRKELEKTNTPPSTEYNRAMTFFDVVDEDENSSLDKVSDKSGKSYESIESQSNLPQVENQVSKSEKDRVAMKQILTTELRKKLTTPALMANENSGVNDFNMSKKKVNGSMENVPSESIGAKKFPHKQIGVEKRTPNDSNVYPLKNKIEQKHQKQVVSGNKFMGAQNDLVQAMKMFEAVEIPTTNVLDADTRQSPSKEDANEDNNKQNSGIKETLDQGAAIEDEKKAAAVERSLNAANYLLQNWGFKRRSSMKRMSMSEDLMKLQYGKKSCSFYYE
jgi:hypothetical protein